ncbi:MAG: redoxin family protein [Pseudomonadota bacterium]
MSGLIAAVVVLWVLVIVLAVVVFALARQVGVLYERVAPAGALMVNQQLKVGDAAPEIAMQSLAGETYSTGANQLLFFLSPDCPICKSLLPVLKTLQRAEPGVEIFLVSDGMSEAEHRAFVGEQNLEQFPYVLSELVGRSFGVGKLPYAVLIDAEAKVVSLGIVNSREHLESLFEAQRLGVGSIQEYLNGEAPAVDLHYDATQTGGESAGR